jgi:hypothetical protein
VEPGEQLVEVTVAARRYRQDEFQWPVMNLLSVAAEHGWNAEGLKTSNSDGVATISLRPCRVAGHEATKLRNILLSAMSNPPSDQADEAALTIQAFLKFLRGGGFNLQRQR